MPKGLKKKTTDARRDLTLQSPQSGAGPYLPNSIKKKGNGHDTSAVQSTSFLIVNYVLVRSTLLLS